MAAASDRITRLLDRSHGFCQKLDEPELLIERSEPDGAAGRSNTIQVRCTPRVAQVLFHASASRVSRHPLLLFNISGQRSDDQVLVCERWKCADPQAGHARRFSVKQLLQLIVYVQFRLSSARAVSSRMAADDARGVDDARSSPDEAGR